MELKKSNSTKSYENVFRKILIVSISLKEIHMSSLRVQDELSFWAANLTLLSIDVASAIGLVQL